MVWHNASWIGMRHWMFLCHYCLSAMPLVYREISNFVLPKPHGLTMQVVTGCLERYSDAMCAQVPISMSSLSRTRNEAVSCTSSSWDFKVLLYPVLRQPNLPRHLELDQACEDASLFIHTITFTFILVSCPCSVRVGDISRLHHTYFIWHK